MKKKQGSKAKSLPTQCKCGHRSTGYSKKDFDERKIHEGSKIEYEHTCNKELAEKISEDHISEMGYQYYPELIKMEAKLLKGLNGKEFMKDNRKTRRNCKT
jgi:hypothetical protein